MCVEVIVCYIIVVFLRHSVYSPVGRFAERAKLSPSLFHYLYHEPKIYNWRKITDVLVWTNATG